MNECFRMASAFNTAIQKQSLKYLEVPLNKFTEEVIPHHQKVYEQYKTTIQKVSNQLALICSLH